jgi:hypothetical protein
LALMYAAVAFVSLSGLLAAASLVEGLGIMNWGCFGL